MKLKFRVPIVLTAFLICLSAQIHAQTSGEVLQKQFGKQTVTVDKDEEILFYDFMGSEPIKGDIYNNVQSLTVFKPAAEGYAVQITFEYLNLESHSEQCPHFLNLYDGETDADNSFVWAEGPFDVTEDNCMLPSGERVRMENTYKSYVYTSASSDGIVSVGHLIRMGKSSDGWKAHVRCVRKGNMKIIAAGTSSEYVKDVPECKYNFPLISFYVDADGTDNADVITSLTFDIEDADKAANIKTLALYRGAADNFDISHKLDENIEQSSEGYRIILSEPLQSGHNVYTLVGSFKDESKVNSKISVQGTGITTKQYPSGYDTFGNIGSVTLLVPPVEYMQSGHSTIGIGDVPITFYDNGGPGKMSPITEGTTTFVPEKMGYKIQIDFRDVKLHKTEYSDKSEEIRIYNGSTADEKNLIKVLTETQTAVVHSTSDDGALTIVYRDNDAGTFYKQDGFMAVVSAFSPSQMKLTGASTQLTGNKACAGTKAVDAMQIVLTTQNTEPALMVQKFDFTTKGTNKNIDYATLYYCGRDAGMTKKSYVGKTKVSGDEFTIKPDRQLPLVEGENYFMLTYDINPEAADGSSINASMSSVMLSDNTYSAEENTGNPLMVDNIIYSEEGIHDITISGRKTFRTRMHSSGETHMPGTEDNVYFFTPAHEGMKMQIDFSSLKLYYSALQYDTHCTFEIYNGYTLNEDFLLWKADSEEKSQNLPDMLLRSTTDDGVLTVRFNPNTTSTAYCSKGFEAEVFEYSEQPMQIEDVLVKQITNDNVKAGDKNVQILDVNVRTMGSAEDYTLDRMMINLKGTEKYAGRASVYDSKMTTMIAETKVNSDDATVTLMFENEILKDGDNHYAVCLDINEDAPEGSVVDASVNTVVLSGKEYKVEKGDPEGCIYLRNILNISGGDNGERTVSSETPLSFYDAGGVEGTCGTDFNGTVTFVPADKNDVIKLIFKSWNVAYGDNMYIYHGSSSEGTADYSFDMKDKELAGREIISKSPDGKITVNFVTLYNDSEGFDIEVRSCMRENLKIEDVNAEVLTEENLFRGSEDVPVMKVIVKVSGNSNPFDITTFSFDNISSKTIKNMHLYATGSNDALYTTDAFGSGRGEITGRYNVSEPGLYHFFVTLDINNEVETGDEISFNLASVNDTAAYARLLTIVKKGISGTLNVGKDKEYITPQDAVDALSQGIDGPVTISIEPGVYTVENLNIPHISGNSSVNTITLTSATGNSRDVKISGYNFNKPTDYEDYYGVVTLDGADYVTLKNLEITTDDKQYPSVVRVKNNSRNITVDSCYIHAETVTGFKDKIVLVETYSKLEEGQSTDNLTISNSILEGGRIGVRFAGASSIYLSDQHGNRLINNVLRNQGMIGVYTVDVSDVEIKGNTITNDVTTASEFKAMDINIDSEGSGTDISGNIVNISAPVKQTLMLLRNVSASAEHPARIYNNQLSGVGGGQLSSAITISGGNFSNTDIAYNTLMMSGTASSSLISVADVLGENVNFVNNIFVNRNDGAVIEFGSEIGSGVKFSSDVFDSASDNVISVGGAYKTFEEFASLPSVDKCFREDVKFLSNEVLTPVEQGSLVNAVPLGYVNTDITGAARSTSLPTIGAYEYESSSSAPIITEGYPIVRNISASSAEVAVRTDISGRVYVAALKYDSAVPSAEDVKSAGVSADVARNKESAITIKQLEKGCTYIVYVVPESMHGITGKVYASDKFIAEGEEYVNPSKLIIIATDVKSEAGAETELTASVSGGRTPYEIVWKDNRNIVLKSEKMDTEGITSVNVSSEECNDYLLEVTDADRNKVTKKIRLIIQGGAVAATFENLYLEEESFWNGSDLNGSFVSGSYKFSNQYEPDMKSWNGFSYSNVTETDFTSYADNTGYASAVGHGNNYSANYAVVNCYVPSYAEVLNTADGDSLRGFYVTNAACAYKSVTEGDGMSEMFDTGDYLLLTISNVDNGSKVEYYLADYRSDDADEHYCLDTWQWVDLRSLGCVKKLMFAVSGSQNNMYGLLTPAYFCMDDFNGHREIPEAPVQNIGTVGTSSIDLSQFFTFDNNKASVVYSIDETFNVPSETHLAVEGSNLVISGADAADMNIIVKAVKKGKVQYVSVPVTYTNSIELIEGMTGKVLYKFDVDGRKIKNDSKSHGVNIIYTADGKVRKVISK